MNQHEWVQQCAEYYNENGLTPEPGWEEAHYPIPECLGGTETVWLTWDHHQAHGLYQSEEFERQCFFNADVKKFLDNSWCSNWFELYDLYDKWSGYNGRIYGKAMNGHPNTAESRSANGVKSKNRESLHLEKDESGRSALAVRMSEEANKNRRLPVLCVETGVSYSSSYEASRLVGGRAAHIRRACSTGGRAGGLHWAYLD